MFSSLRGQSFRMIYGYVFDCLSLHRCAPSIVSGAVSICFSVVSVAKCHRFFGYDIAISDVKM
jgi:hypothetical protein